MDGAEAGMERTGEARAGGVVERVARTACRAADRNIRRRGARRADDEMLAASIAHHGLIHNLVGYREGDTVVITSGQRRLAALEGRADAPEEVDVRIYPSRAEAESVSVAENVARAAMHEADVAEALGEEVRGGASMRELARRYGMKLGRARVLGRLGTLAREWLDAWREGRITQRQAQAVADHTPRREQQEALWRQVAEAYPEGAIPDSAVGAASEEEGGGDVRASHAAARFVGEEGYVAAGGHVAAGLFDADPAESIWTDGALVARLAERGLEEWARAQELAGWGRVEIRTGLNGSGAAGGSASDDPGWTEGQRSSGAVEVGLDRTGRPILRYRPGPEPEEAPAPAPDGGGLPTGLAEALAEGRGGALESWIEAAQAEGPPPEGGTAGWWQRVEQRQAEAARAAAAGDGGTEEIEPEMRGSGPAPTDAPLSAGEVLPEGLDDLLDAGA